MPPYRRRNSAANRPPRPPPEYQPVGRLYPAVTRAREAMAC